MNLPLGKWFGVLVILHWSWVLCFAFVALTAPSFALTYAGVFLLVLLHELGHCMAGHYFCLSVENITLYPFGGIAHMEVPVEPRREAVVAIAGPAVNAVLALLFLWTGFCHDLAYYNMVLLVFNLLPAFPMDGGRIFRAAMVSVMRSHWRGTWVASRTGQGFAVFFGVMAVIFGSIMLGVIGVLVWLAATAELSKARSQASAELNLAASARMLKDIENRMIRLGKE